MPSYRILIVDDSAFMRKFISDIVAEEKQFTVVGTAVNGREALEAVKRLRPDAVTMDLEMPEMSGLEALTAMMKETPTPVVMLSSSTYEGAHATIQALEHGAFDFVAKPSGISSDAYNMKDSLLATLRAAVADKKGRATKLLKPPPIPSAEHQRTDPHHGSDRRAAPAALPKPPPKRLRLGRQLVAIGTSTGGPRALQQVLRGLPADFPAAVLIVQHMPPGFTKSLAARLDSLCDIQVVEAEDGMEPMQGTAYIAPGGHHMVLRREAGRYKLRLTDEPPVSGHRPSVDALFQSLAAFPELDRTVVLMTGMGSDGAKGMKLLHDQGVERTIAEDESSCIVYGMPRSAVQLGCVRSCIPLQDIADQIIRDIAQNEEV